MYNGSLIYTEKENKKEEKKKVNNNNLQRNFTGMELYRIWPR